MRQIKAQPEPDTPRITKMKGGGYHIAGDDGDEFELEGLRLFLYYNGSLEHVSIEMADGYYDDDEGQWIRGDNFVVAETSIEDEPETALFEITVTREQMDAAIAYRKDNPLS